MMGAIEIWLKGRKTYIISILGILTVFVGWLSGDMSFMQFVSSESFQTMLQWAGLGTVRAALAK